MEDLTKKQMVLLMLLVSFVTSLSTVVVTLSILDEVPEAAPQTILQRVIQRVTDKSEDVSERGEVVIKEEDLVIEVAAQASPAVVSIVAAKDLPVVQRFFFDPFGSGDISGGTEHREIGRGSGFIVSKDGMLVTNRHVVSDLEAEYTVILSSGNTYQANVLARDPVHDIAILTIDGGPFPFVPLGNSDTIRIGQTVIAIGNALGEFDNTVSVGILSGKERTLTAFGGSAGPSDLQRVLQTDAAINPGNSGGPLLNTAGEVIGINTAIVSGAENIGFAVPVNIARRDIEQVKKTGRIIYPFLGVRYVTITDAIRQENGIHAKFGVLVVGSAQNPAVLPGSPADKAGLREGDIITHAGGTMLDRDTSLAEIIQMKNVGDTVTLTVQREGKNMLMTVTLAERP